MKKLDTSYTQMPNYHLRDKTLSLKAKGLLSLMLSLPAEWDYSVSGIATLSNDGKSATMSAIRELEDRGYLVREQRKENGKFAEYKYTVFEIPEQDLF